MVGSRLVLRRNALMFFHEQIDPLLGYVTLTVCSTDHAVCLDGPELCDASLQESE